MDTLFYPVESGAVAAPEGGRFLFLNAPPGLRLPEGFGAGLQCVQGFRPTFRALQSAGKAVSTQIEANGFDGALVLAGKHRGQNEAWIADAVEHTVPGGLVLVAGGNEDGISSLRKRVETLVGLDGSLPKYHGTAFWFRRPADATGMLSVLRPVPALVDHRFGTAPGMFSFDRIDKGSRLLAECLPESATGRAADFGAGWGYLSAELAARTMGLTAIDLYEADHASLEAARKNLSAFSSLEFGFHWTDLAAEPVERKYDLIVMNPPFHQGHATDPGLGLAMIKVAASALNRGGRLLMVANRGLPYDRLLAQAFGKVTEIRNEAGFRVIAANA